MDIVTHGLLGALVGQSLSRSRNIRLASAIGCVAALLPDLDVLIQSNQDPLLLLEYHRHFTHSLLFAPFAALLVTLICTPLFKRDFSKFQLYGVVVLAYLSACLLDACTSYGTHLFWPLISEPMALAIIAVVDPLFSLVLLVTVISAWLGRSRQRAAIGLALALCYLCIGLLQHQRAQTAAETLYSANKSIISIDVKPTMGNLLLWRALMVDSDNHLRVDAIHLSFTQRIYPGETHALIDLNTWEQLPHESRAYQDLLRYQQLSHALLISHSQPPLMIGDARFSMLPTSIDPLWGLQVNPLLPNSQSPFVARRTFTPAMRDTFIAMLLGRDINRDKE